MKTSSKVPAVIEKEVPSVAKLAQGLEIKDAQSMETASELRTRLKSMAKKVDLEKSKVLDPLNEARKAEMARWKPTESMIEQALEAIDEKMSVYQTAEMKRANDEAAAIANRVGEGKGKFKVETAIKKIEGIDAPAKVVASSIGGTKFRTDKKLKIMDETMIPREYLEINERKILDALKAGIEVPGAIIELVQTPVNF